MKNCIKCLILFTCLIYGNSYAEKKAVISDYYAINCKKNSWSPQMAIGSRRGVKAMMKTQKVCQKHCESVQQKQCGDFALAYKKKFNGVFVPRNLQKVGKLTQAFVNEFKIGCNKFVIKEKCQCCKMGYTLYQTRY